MQDESSSFDHIISGLVPFLKSRIDLSHGLLNKLLTRKLLTERDVADIEKHSSESGKAEALLKRLKHQDDDQVPAFKEALIADNQQYIWDNYLSQAVNVIPCTVCVKSDSPERNSLREDAGESFATKLTRVVKLVNEHRTSTEMSSLRASTKRPEFDDIDRVKMTNKLESKIESAFSQHGLDTEKTKCLKVVVRMLFMYDCQPEFVKHSRAILLYFPCSSVADVNNVKKVIESGEFNEPLTAAVEEHYGLSNVKVELAMKPADYEFALKFFNNTVQEHDDLADVDVDLSDEHALKSFDSKLVEEHDYFLSNVEVDLAVKPNVGNDNPSRLTDTSIADQMIDQNLLNSTAVDDEDETIDAAELLLLQLNDWLMSEPWAKEIAYDGERIKIGILDTSTFSETEARSLLESKGFGSLVYSCSFVPATKGEYKPAGDRPEDPATRDLRIKSGDAIATSPDIVGMAVFSGAITIDSVGGFGLTVAHMFKHARTGKREIYQVPPRDANHRPVGDHKLKISEPIHKYPSIAAGLTTTDICFLRVDNDVRLKNEFIIEGQTYSLRLFRGQLQTGMEVIIFNRTGKLCRAQLRELTFSDTHVNPTQTIYRALAIAAETEIGSLIQVTTKGDSGALVMIEDKTDNENLYVIGMVIGHWENPYYPQSYTIASRLLDVLEAVGKNDCYCLTLTDKKSIRIDHTKIEFVYKSDD